MARFGIIAPEFPPSVGGMERLAYELATSLGTSDDVTVYTPNRRGSGPCGRFRQECTLHGQLHVDVATLRSVDVDAWLGLNGGLLPLLVQLPAPSFAYLHGNDFLAPWLGYASWWLEPLRRPYITSLRQWVRRRGLRACAGRIAHFFTNSQKTAALAAAQFGLGSESFTVCPPGVTDAFFGIERLGKAGPLKLLTVARMTKHSRRKNVDGVIRALATLRTELDFLYTVVGDGDDRKRIEALADSCGLSGRISFTGELSDADLMRRYAEADLFVLTSTASPSDVEGFGIVYLEASAAGIPVLASRGGGAPEAVADGVSGILIPDASPASIADGIRRYVHERERFSVEASRGWAACYRWSVIARELRSVMLRHLDRTTDRVEAPWSTEAPAR
jgi:glycosyltransferase involved in cell wall biosynthesis